MARQYCGPLGKVENCQVGVFAGYASRHGYALVDKRLFLPEVWWTDAYATRRTKCNVPDELMFQSKPQLAAAMLQGIVREGLLPALRKVVRAWRAEHYILAWWTEEADDVNAAMKQVDVVFSH